MITEQACSVAQRTALYRRLRRENPGNRQVAGPWMMKGTLGLPLQDFERVMALVAIPGPEPVQVMWRAQRDEAANRIRCANMIAAVWNF